MNESKLDRAARLIRDSPREPVSELRLEQAKRYALAHAVQDARARPRSRRVWILGGAVALAASAALFVVVERSKPAPHQDEASATVTRTQTHPKELARGIDEPSVPSAAEPPVLALTSSQEEIDLDLVSGSVVLEVRPADGASEVRLRAGAYSLIAETGQYRLERDEDELAVVAIAVLSGHLKVEAEGLTAELGEGESISFRPSGREPPVDGSRKRAGKPADAATRVESVPGPEELARAGHALRRAGKLREAGELFERFVDTYPKHARAPMAWMEIAFARESLGRNRAAAQAFDEVWHRWPGHSLAVDAAASSATIWGARGQASSAKAAARFYLEHAPAGSEAERMRALTGD